MPRLEDVLIRHLGTWQSGWSMGSFGALAEFMQDEGEPFAGGPLWRVTSRGGIRIDLLPETVPVAYETVSPKEHRWGQSVALCLPEEVSRTAARTVLTELGPDADAIRDEDREAVLFDMGLGQIQVDFCIRTRDAGLIDQLREQSGQSLFDPGNPAMGAILSAHPHRVAITRLGRCEVFQKIGGPDTDGRSPEGPHTHVLPKLLQSGRTHSANVPIPEGLVPCAGLHPGNPVIDALGRDRVFDPKLFDEFQELLSEWGNADYVDAKTATWAVLRQSGSGSDIPEAPTRHGRAGQRNAMRQYRYMAAGTE